MASSIKREAAEETATEHLLLSPLPAGAQEACDPDALAEAVRRGDVTVLEHLTRCFGRRMLAVGRRRCRDDEEARDAVQDALLSAGTHLTSFRGDGSLEGWLTRMVANACSHRRRGRKNDASLHVTEIVLPTLDSSPEDQAHRAHVGEVLEQALLEIPPLDRAILILAEGGDWTGPEIGRKFDLSPTAVRVRLTRTRARLRHILAPLQREDRP
jgi:RNA polymerase sigma-70 factor (ECF subfamily)